MEIQPLKRALSLIILILFIILTSCNDMNSQTKQIIQHNRVVLNDELEKLEREKVLKPSEAKQIQERLNADFDYYLQHQHIDLAGLEKMFFATVKSFENFRITQPVFSRISSTYHVITSQGDYAIQLQFNKLLNDWFDKYQTEAEKINDVVNQTIKTKQLKIYMDIPDAEYEEIIATLNKIKNDTTISDDELKKILKAGMLQYGNKSDNSNLEILNIYESVSRIKKLEISEDLLAIYNRNTTQSELPAYPEIEKQILGRFNVLLSEEMITQEEFTYYTQTIIDDVNFCAIHSDQPQIKPRLLLGLQKLKMAELDTEDREAIAHWYYVLSLKHKIELTSELNKWLYGFDPK